MGCVEVLMVVSGLGGFAAGASMQRVSKCDLVDFVGPPPKKKVYNGKWY